MRTKVMFLCAALGLLAAALAATAGVGSAAPERSADTKLSLVAYSTPREAYGKLIPAVPEDGRRAKTSTSRSRTAPPASRRGRSRPASRPTSSRSRSLPTSTSSSRRTSSTRSGRSSPTRAWSRTRSSSSSCATATRRRSRAGTTSSSPDVEVITPNPFTSGGARWNVMAAYGAWRKAGKTDKQAQANLLEALQERRRPGHERARVAQHLQQRQGRRAPRVRERGDFAAHAGPEPPVRHPEGDDPDREPDRRH